jgi:putative ABC transport system permease protein
MISVYQAILLSLKYAARNRVRSILTIIGIASGMFLYTSVETLQRSLKTMTEATAGDTTLVVYRENRFCPSTSRLPEHYMAEIRRIPSVVEAVPILIVVNNCGASLDVITFRGVPSGELFRYNPDLKVLDGSLEDWKERGDGALIGRHFAAARRLSVGDRFEAAGVTTTISGIIDSPHPQDNSVAYVHLPFLQQTSNIGLGTVTQFNVRVASSDQLEPVAEAIDTLFGSDSAPTVTRPEKAFFAQTAKDMIELIGFTQWMGLGAVLAVIALVSNALVLVARSRVKESAVLQTIGYQQNSIRLLMISEGGLLGFVGGLLGTLGAMAFFSLNRFTFGNEGLTLAIEPSWVVAVMATITAGLLGLLSSLWPAFTAARKPIVQSLRGA